MPQQYTVKQGDSLTSIAFELGLNWETIWNHSQNGQLKNDRQDPHVIYPGDVLYIPDKTPRIEPRATDAKHSFTRVGVPDKLQIRLLKDFEPRANVPYTLTIDGKSINGTTDGDGWVREFISPGAKQGKLTLEGGQDEYALALGNIDPLDTVSGMQGRLFNLGFLAEQVTGEMDDATRSALQAFQAAKGLPQTGEADDATREKLKSEYGC